MCACRYNFQLEATAPYTGVLLAPAESAKAKAFFRYGVYPDRDTGRTEDGQKFLCLVFNEVDFIIYDSVP